MIKRRIGNDIPIEWSLTRNAQEESFSGKTLRLYIYEIGGDKFEYTDHITYSPSTNIVTFTWKAEDQKEAGIYNLIIEEYQGGVLINTADINEAICLTAHTSEQNGETDYIGDRTCVFTSELSVMYNAYDRLVEIIAASETIIALLRQLGIEAGASGTTLAEKIAELEALIERVRQYQLSYGEDHPYIDQKVQELYTYTQRTWRDVVESMQAIREEMLDGFTDSISPIAVKTMQTVVGADELQFEFIEAVDDDTIDYGYDLLVKTEMTWRKYNTYENGRKVVYGDTVYLMVATDPCRGIYPDSPEAEGIWQSLGERQGAYHSADYVAPEEETEEPDYDVIELPDAVIKHYTIGIHEVRNAEGDTEQGGSMPIDQYRRWEIHDQSDEPIVEGKTRFYIEDSNKLYRVYIKASKSYSVPNTGNEETEDETVWQSTNEGGIGDSAEFYVTKQAMPFDDGDEDGYYYLLYAYVGSESNGNRSINTWNGFTEITPGRVTAQKFISPDGYQYIDFLNKIFRIGDANKFLAYNIGNDGVLRLKGTIVQSPSGDEFPTPCYRGVWIKNEEGEEPNQVAYYGDLFTYEGQGWLCIDESAVDEDTAIAENPSEESEYWILYSTKGETAVSTFKSIVFTRTNSTPATPTGGTYDSPIPTDTKPDGSLIWSDGVPAGEEQLWMSTRVFANTDDPEYETEWTTPSAATDTADIDFEYSAVETNPGNPDDDPDNWHNDATQNDIWMAVRKKKNGAPVIPVGSTTKGWEISKIKGEKGDDGDSPVFADLDNEMEGVALNSEGKTTEQKQLVTNVSLSFGTIPITLSSISVSGLTTGITETHTLSSGRIVFTIASGATVGDNVPITITLTGNFGQTTYTRNLVFTIAGVKAGANGDDAVIYSILPSVSSVKKDKDGHYSDSEVSCTRYKRVGNGNLETTTDGTLKYKLDTGSEQTYTGAISTTAFVTKLTFLFYVNNTLVDKETIPLLYDGTNGAPGDPGLDGVAIRGPREWAQSGTSSIVYQSGRKAYDGTGFPVDEFLDIVRYNNAYYRCKKTHISTAQTAPPTSVDQNTYWERATEFSFVATKLLLAEDGKIDFLSGNVIRLLYKDSLGNETVTGGAKGAASETDIVFWAGADGTTKPLSQSPFKVLKDGTTHLSKLIIDDSTSNVQSKIVLGVDGGRFFRVNYYGSNGPMVQVRADGKDAISATGYGDGSVAIKALTSGSGSTKAIESNGNVELRLGSNETARIGYSNGGQFDMENIVSAPEIKHIVIENTTHTGTSNDTLYIVI